MTPQQLKQHFGVETQTALAGALDKPISTVAEWFQKNRVPRAVLLELQLNGKIPRQEDRPQ